MRILIINQYATTGDSAGGTRHIDLARIIVSRGHQVCILAGSYDARKEATVVDGVHLRWLSVMKYRGNGARRFLSMMKFGHDAAWAELPFNPDVVIGSSVHPFAALAGWVQAKRHRTPFVFEIRDLWPETLIALGGYSRWSPPIVLLSILERFLCSNASAIISLLPLAQRYLQGIGVPKQKVHYIPNGVDLTLFDQRRAGSKPLEIGSRDRFRVLYSGAHGVANNLGLLLDAAEILERQQAPVEFVLVGDGAEKPNLARQAAKMGLQTVRFADPVPKSLIPSVLEDADVLCAAARETDLYRYGISFNKLFDYFAAAKPIVFAGRVEPDLVTRSGSGITVPGDEPTALAEAVLHMLRMSPQERLTLGRAGREFAEREHSISLLAQRLLVLLSQLTGDGSVR